MKQRSDHNRTAGQDLVEYALILPLLLLLLLGIMEFGRVMMTYNTLSNAAREGARAAIVPSVTADNADDVVRMAALRLAGHLNPAPDVDVVTFGRTTVTVRVASSVRLVTGPIIQALGGSDTIPLQAVATMRRE